jgi:ribonuclease D
MSKLIKRAISKAEISVLPVVTFEGRIVAIQTVTDAEKAIDYLLTQKMVGVDTETRPSFVSGKSYKVSLLQVSTDEVCFLFRLNYIGFPQCIQRFIEDEKVMKIGLSLKDDFGALHKRSNFEPGEFIELQEYVRQFGIDDLSLQKIYAILFGQRISKNQRLSNWEAEVLNDRQKIYAATDAWACLMIYRYMENLRQTGDYQIEEKKIETIVKEEHGV